MLPRLAACAAGLVCFLIVPLGAQQWNDARTLGVVDAAIARRAAQLADTGLVGYRANAHGFLTFLAQVGDQLDSPPKVVRTDELAVEVYWRAPNLSKQRIVGRRDTLLLPTDIEYHRDHLAIVQNNFPGIIRLGDGDEVQDVPHPLSAAGREAYEFAATDSFVIRTIDRTFEVLEVKVRPRDDRAPRAVGAVYLDKSNGVVVRMAFSFTRVALKDPQLEDVSVILENGLVGGRFWLPRRQEIEIRRTGSWMDFPVRGIIRGRWEITDADLLAPQAPAFFAGPEVESLPEPQLRSHPFAGDILATLPADIRLSADDDVRKVQDEARALVRAEALARTQRFVPSARSLSDILRVNRVDGLAIGGGITQAFGAGLSLTGRGRYGLSDHALKHEIVLAYTRADGAGLSLGVRDDFRELGDAQEVSGVRNSIAAQEWGSDLTDPIGVRGGWLALDAGVHLGHRWRFTLAREDERGLDVTARPSSGRYAPTTPILATRVERAALDVARVSTTPMFGFTVSGHANATLRRIASPTSAAPLTHARLALSIHAERPLGADRVVLHTTAAMARFDRGAILCAETAQLLPSGGCPLASLLRYDIRFGGPVTAPGYDFHSLRGTAGVSQRVEWQHRVADVPLSLGRFGRSRVALTAAPWVQLTALDGDAGMGHVRGFFPSVGLGVVSIFDLLRLDLARGLRDGRWTFAVDLSRDLWPIL